MSVLILIEMDSVCVRFSFKRNGFRMDSVCVRLA